MGGASKPCFNANEFVKLYEKHGGVKAVARATGQHYVRVQQSYHLAVAEGLMDAIRPGRKTIEHVTKTIKGQVKAKQKAEPVIEGKLRARRAFPLERKQSGVTRFLFTSAQNNTPVFDKFWDNLTFFAEHVGARILVSRFAYIKSGLGARGDKKHWFDQEPGKTQAKSEFWFDPKIADYVCDERREIAPGLIWVGDANIMPTRVSPLSGKETFTGRASGVFPHVKVEMQSVATVNPDEPTKFNYTTGTVTLRNYIARDAGLMAEFHHVYGALLVEVTEDGDWFCRQVNADSEGSFYEFDPKGNGAILVRNGKITSGHRIEAFNAGDNHAEDEDFEVFKATWGEGGLVDTLRPKFQFYNDLASFTPRSHHSVKDLHKQFLYHRNGEENVLENMGAVLQYLKRTARSWCQNIVVNSNHDRHVGRWLKEQDGRRDPVNAKFWIDLNKATYDWMASYGSEPNHLQLALRLVDSKFEKQIGVQFLSSDGSFIVCHDSGGGIECGMHGDLGPNGARGSIRNIAKLGRKANIGHSHSAGIYGGVYQAGTSSKLRLDYNSGPSSWSQSHIVTYPNGKRTIVTVWRGKWRA